MPEVPAGGDSSSDIWLVETDPAYLKQAAPLAAEQPTNGATIAA